MKIGIDARLIGETGVGRYIRNLLRYLSVLDSQNSYYIYTKKEAVEEVSHIMPKAVIRVSDIRWHTLKEQLLMPFIFGRDTLDILHVPYFSVPVFYSGTLIVTIHDLIPLHVRTGKASTTLPFPLFFLKKILYRFVLSEGIRKAVAVIAVSKTTKEEIITHYPSAKGKVQIIGEGVDESLLLYRGKKLDNPVRDPFLLYVGNVYPHKNVKTALQAYAMVKTFLPKKIRPQFIFIGKADAFTKQIKHDPLVRLDPSVHFLTDVSDRQLASYYTFASALVFPSEMEGFGLPVIEAIAFGCPVILSDIPVFNELFSSVGHFSHPKDVAGFAHHMGFALSGNIGNIALPIQDRYISMYRWSDAARRTLDLYEDSNRL